MAARRDYYEVLGVPPDAHATAIKNVSRRGARMPRVAGTSVTCALAARCRPWP